MNGKFPGINIDLVHDRIPGRKVTMEAEYTEVVLRYRKRPSTPEIMHQREMARAYYMARRDEINAKRRAKRAADRESREIHAIREANIEKG